MWALAHDVGSRPHRLAHIVGDVGERWIDSSHDWSRSRGKNEVQSMPTAGDVGSHPFAASAVAAAGTAGAGAGVDASAALVPTVPVMVLMFTTASSAAALIPTVRFAAVTLNVGVVLYVRWSTLLRRLGHSVRWSNPTVWFTVVTAGVGVGRRVYWSTRQLGPRLPLVADVIWKIHRVQKLRTHFLA